jgi:hypothetical protein
MNTRTQAIVANVILREKAMAWAAESNGYFPIDATYDSEQSRRGEMFVRWRDIKHEEDAMQRVCWPEVKRTRVSAE